MRNESGGQDGLEELDEAPAPFTESDGASIQPRPASQRFKAWRRRLLGMLFSVGRIYLILLVMAFFLQRYILFPVDLASENQRETARGAVAEQWWLQTSEGRVEAWFSPGRGCTKDSPGPAVIYTHGNAELIDQMPAVMRGYNQIGVSVLLVEYRGYGRSQGSPSEANLVQDAIQWHDRLIERPEVDKTRLIYHGFSLGSGVACGLGAHRRPAALILYAPFTSVRRMMAGYLIPGPLCLDPFDNLRFVEGYGGPLLVCHGTRDRVVPHWHGRRLAEAGKGTLQSYEGKDHTDIPLDWAMIRGFLAESGLFKGK